MAHTDLLIFFNTAFWVFFLFVIIYLLILVIFSSNTYFRVRIFSIHRIFLMTCLLSFFQLGIVLSKILNFFVVFYNNLAIFFVNLSSFNTYFSSLRVFSTYQEIRVKQKKLIATYLNF